MLVVEEKLHLAVRVKEQEIHLAVNCILANEKKKRIASNLLTLK